MTTEELLIIDYEDLIWKEGDEEKKKLQDILKKAYGPDGIGLLGIRHVPGFLQAKQALLPLAHVLATRPAEELAALEDPHSFYNAGWSHGKEQLKPNTPDWNKASFYFNPIVDTPGTPQEREQYPASYPSNKWPSSGPTSPLSSLEPTAKTLGHLMKDVVVLLSRHLDAYVSKDNNDTQKEAPHFSFYESMKDTEKVKGRLLYYYPLKGDDQSDQDGDSPAASQETEDSWIGWHNDSGFLTALAGDIYMDPKSGAILDTSPCPSAGLYVVADHRNQGNEQTPTTEMKKVELPPDCMAVQIGECAQIVTGGSLMATPHCVRGAPQVARASLACFIDTPPNFVLRAPPSSSGDDVVSGSSHPKVPPLSKRWKPDQTFGDFLQSTFQMYYDWNTTDK